MASTGPTAANTSTAVWSCRSPTRTAAIVQLYGRRIDPKAPKENRHLYLARPLAGIFNAGRAQSPGNHPRRVDHRRADLHPPRHGGRDLHIRHRELHPELFEAIRAAKVESVRLAFDADKAGEAAAAKAANRLQAVGIECHRIRFPWGSDANAYALDQGAGALRRAVQSAEWIDEGRERGPGGPALNGRDASSKDRTTVSTVVASSLAAEKEAAKKEKSSPKPSGAVELVRRGEYHEAAFGPRLYRIGGLEKNNGLEVLKITLRISCEGLMHVDSLDLYRDGERRKFIERAAEETTLERDLLKRDLGKLLLALEQAQEARINDPGDEAGTVTLSAADEAEALELLRAPDLLARIAKAYDEAGIVGEDTNKVAAYLAGVSRMLARPLAVIIQSTSAAGKSALMEAVLSFFPAEDQVKYSAMTGQSLYYLGESDLKHRILAIVEEEGAEKASYALKLLQSEGELTIASTGKDPHSGRMETQEYHVEGPVAIVLTTTSIDIDEELMNRCLVLTRRRVPRANRAHPRPAARGPDRRGHPRRRETRRRAAGHAERATPVAAVEDRQPLRPGTDLHQRPDQDTPRPRKVSDADRRHRPAPPAPARTRHAHRQRPHCRDASRHPRRHRGGEPDRAGSPRPQPRRTAAADPQPVGVDQGAGPRQDEIASRRATPVPLRPPGTARGERLERVPGADPSRTAGGDGIRAAPPGTPGQPLRLRASRRCGRARRKLARRPDRRCETAPQETVKSTPTPPTSWGLEGASSPFVICTSRSCSPCRTRLPGKLRGFVQSHIRSREKPSS